MTSLLDEIWDGAPFQDKSALVGHVQATVDTWVSAGLLSQSNGQTVVNTANSATYVS